MSVAIGKTCRGKHQHKTLKKAAQHRQRILEHDRTNKNVQVYRCDHCGFFHVGTLR